MRAFMIQIFDRIAVTRVSASIHTSDEFDNFASLNTIIESIAFHVSSFLAALTGSSAWPISGSVPIMGSVLSGASRSRGSNAHVDLVDAIGYGSLVAPTTMRAGTSGAIAICIKPLDAAVGESG